MLKVEIKLDILFEQDKDNEKYIYFFKGCRGMV